MRFRISPRRPSSFGAWTLTVLLSFARPSPRTPSSPPMRGLSVLRRGGRLAFEVGLSPPARSRSTSTPRGLRPARLSSTRGSSSTIPHPDPPPAGGGERGRPPLGVLRSPLRGRESGSGPPWRLTPTLPLRGRESGLGHRGGSPRPSPCGGGRKVKFE